MYSRPIKIYQGIDNPMQIVVLNQDQKPVDLTGYALQADIQDPLNEVTAYSYAVAFTDQAKGRGTFIIPNAEATSLEQRFYKLTLKTIADDDGAERPIYIDANWTAPVDLEVLPAYYNTTPEVFSVNESIIDSGQLP